MYRVREQLRSRQRQRQRERQRQGQGRVVVIMVNILHLDSLPSDECSLHVKERGKGELSEGEREGGIE